MRFNSREQIEKGGEENSISSLFAEREEEGKASGKWYDPFRLGRFAPISEKKVLLYAEAERWNRDFV